MGAVIDIDVKPGERVRFISDLHLAHERCQALTDYDLESVVRGTDILVSNGDLSETRPCPWREMGVRLRADFHALCARHGVRLIELAGNHDPALPHLAARFWGGRVVAMHGHAIFREIAPWSWEYINNKELFRSIIAACPEADTDLEARLELSRRLSSAVSPIFKRRGPHIPVVSSLLHCFWPPERPLQIIRGWLTSPGLANRFAGQYFPQAETVVLGHFHRHCFRRFPGRTVINTGAWFKHATPYVLDMVDARVEDFYPAPAHTARQIPQI